VGENNLNAAYQYGDHLTKLCIITPFPPEQDGLAMYSKRFVDAFLLKANTSVVVLCQSSAEDTNESVRKSNLKVLRIWKPQSLFNQLRIWRAITSLHPDIVDVQYGPFGRFGGLIGEPLFMLFMLLRLSRLRAVLTMHSIWLPGEAASRAFERTRRKSLSVIAGLYYWMFMLLFLKLPSRILIVVAFEHSPITRDMKAVFHLPSQKLKEIVHGTLPPMHDITKKLSSKSRLHLLDRRVFLTFGFIRSDKGIELALRSLDELRGRNVLIVAGMPLTKDDIRYLSYLKALTLELRLNDHIRFDTRFVPESDLEDYLNAADVLLLPYTRRVGPSGPLATAASFGLPVISVYDGKWLVRGNSFVYLLRKADDRELLQAMREIEVKERVMTKNAIDYASRYRFENIVEEYMFLVQGRRLGR